MRGWWSCRGGGLRRGGDVATASLFSREGGSPDWVPAFAGKHGGTAVASQCCHPGGGRGQVGGRCQLNAPLRYCDLSNWAPAFAGVVFLLGDGHLAYHEGAVATARSPILAQPRSSPYRVRSSGHSPRATTARTARRGGVARGSAGTSAATAARTRRSRRRARPSSADRVCRAIARSCRAPIPAAAMPPAHRNRIALGQFRRGGDQDTGNQGLEREIEHAPCALPTRLSATLPIGNMGHFPASGTPLLPRRCALTFES